MTKSDTTRVAIITGASSGIGLATAELFAKSGYKTYGLSRRKIGRKDFIEIQADVTNDESVQLAIGQILRDEGRIDVLVNNAGFVTVGAAEELSIVQAKAIFETNFFGVFRTTNAVLPTMRAQRSGRILHTSSIVGLVPAPYMGLYAASKHAVEGYSESLDHEVRSFGIRSIAVEPGLMRTSINAHGMNGEHLMNDYAVPRESLRKLLETGVSSAAEPNLVAETFLFAAQTKTPDLRYPVGKDAKTVSIMRRILPRKIFDKSFRSQFGLDRKS